MYNSRRRSSMIEIHNINSSLSNGNSLLMKEDDKTKLLLAAKTPNIISKRRGSTVSIEALQSNSRRNSITTTTTTFTTNSNNNIITTTTTNIHTTQISNYHHLPISNNKSGNYVKNNAKDDSSMHSRSLSQPIPHFSPHRPLIPSANYDNHNQYKKRNELSSKKLTNFFGDKPPIDICVKEIEKEGLKAMLHSKIPLCYFLYSLLEEYSCENLYTNSSLQEQQNNIFNTYLTRNSQFEVNVDDKVRKSVIASIESNYNPRHCFDEAKRAIFVLLESSFSRFIRSDLSEIMKKEIGKTTTHYPPEARDSAITLLFKFLDRQNNSSSSLPPSSNLFLKSKPKSTSTSSKLYNSPPPSNSTSPIASPTSMISQKRHELIRAMIYEFLMEIWEELMKMDLELVEE
ncbi:7556_t:CDS:2 [Diversispora eburnea]|uniref:7556_t:CDS:1 n=1 Tax=Diversispora eburnea TaxID=1213867 RepID=A0A9N8YTH9_9GLOM|nr:7556_t:CDS:2 [Diversispora eburnea]